MQDLYNAAGVSLENGYKSVDLIKKDVTRTSINGVMSSIGGFASMFDLSEVEVKNPVLVSGCDGVGTKILIAQAANDFSTIGQDLVAMSVNDIIVTGAQPLYFLDYIACGKNDPEVIASIVKSIADGCVLSNCALVGGETAEMPDCYEPGSYDLAGFVVGVVDKQKIIDPTKVKPGDVIIGLDSNGLHANGFSLVRKLLFKDNDFKFEDKIGEITLIEELLKPTRIYTKDVMHALSLFDVKAMSHITGGGFVENLPRSLNGYGAKIDLDALKSHEIFDLLQELMQATKSQMCQYFNMGIGLTFVVAKEDVTSFLDTIEGSQVIGHVTQNSGIEF